MALLEVVARVVRHRLWTSTEGAERSVAARVVHFDHRTRPGPDGNQADAALVVDRALALGLPVSVHVLDLKQLPRGNFHDVARTWRYALLEQERAALQARLAGAHTSSPTSNATVPSTWILTAHHARDTVETMLLRLSRGTGPQGLRGIPALAPERRVWRPFASTAYARLETYARESRLSWRDDPTNDALDYSRNKVRHGLLPTLEQLNPAYEEAFLRFAAALDDTLRAQGGGGGEGGGDAGAVGDVDRNGNRLPRSPEELRRRSLEVARSEGNDAGTALLLRLTGAQWRNLHAHCVKSASERTAGTTRVPLGGGAIADVTRGKLRFFPT